MPTKTREPGRLGQVGPVGNTWLHEPPRGIMHVRYGGDIVAKVFLGWRTKILRAADALCARRCEGPYRFIQNRARTFVAALKSDAAAEKAKIGFREILRAERFSTFATKSGT